MRRDYSESDDGFLVVESCGVQASEDDDASAMVDLIAYRGQLVGQLQW